MDKARVGVLLTSIGLCISGTAYSDPLTLTGVGTHNFAVIVNSGVIPDPEIELTGSLRADQDGSSIWASDIAAKGIASSTFITFDIDPAAPAAVPEPATLVLIGTGLLGLAHIARRRLRSDTRTPDQRLATDDSRFTVRDSRLVIRDQ